MIGTLVSTGRRRDLAAGQQRAIVVVAAIFSAWVIYANLFTISDPLVRGILFVPPNAAQAIVTIDEPLKDQGSRR